MVGQHRLDEYGCDHERRVCGQKIDADHAAESKWRRHYLAIQSIRHAEFLSASRARHPLQFRRIFQERRPFATVATLAAMDLGEDRCQYQRSPRPAVSELFYALLQH